MKIILKVKRFNPESDARPYFQEYTVEANPNDRLLDLESAACVLETLS